MMKVTYKYEYTLHSI